MQRNWLCYILSWEDKSFAHCGPADHDFIVVFIFLGKFLKLQMPISQIHNILKPFLTYWGEILRRFELGLINNKIEHDFVLVLADKFALVDRVD